MVNRLWLEQSQESTQLDTRRRRLEISQLSWDMPTPSFTNALSAHHHRATSRMDHSKKIKLYARKWIAKVHSSS